MDNVEYDIQPIVDDVIESIRNDNLSFDLAVLMHQLMWSWIYSETKNGRVAIKSDFCRICGLFNSLDLFIKMGQNSHCFFCLYAKSVCSDCPAIWNGGDKCVSHKRTIKTEYEEWLKAFRIYNVYSMTKAALKMAKVKIRNKNLD